MNGCRGVAGNIQFKCKVGRHKPGAVMRALECPDCDSADWVRAVDFWLGCRLDGRHPLLNSEQGPPHTDTHP
jgi:hypothetical protein